MTKNSIKTAAVLSLFSGLLLTGCLKDKEYDNRSIQSNHTEGDGSKVIEIGLTATSSSNFQGLSFNASANDTTLSLIPVNLASSEPAQEDINVTLTKNDALITAYNTSKGTAFTPATTSMFTIVNPGGVVTIPKGSYTGYLMIKFKPNSFLGADYAIGYTVSNVDKSGYLISGNLQNGIVSIAIKNQYDGIYNIRGFHTRGGDPTLTGPTGVFQRALVTSGGSTTVTWTGTVPWGYQASNLPAGYEPIITVNATTNKVTITSANGLSSQDNSYNNRYDPATKTYYFKWGYSAAAERSFVDTLVYVKPR